MEKAEEAGQTVGGGRERCERRLERLARRALLRLRQAQLLPQQLA